MEVDFAQQALISIIVQLFFIGITWWALMGLKLETLLKKGRVVQFRLLLILLTIAIGATVGNFFLDYLFWSRQLQYLF